MTEKPITLEELEEQRNTLIDRLDAGAIKIQQGDAEGRDTSEWQAFWIQLLRRYEDICEQIRNWREPEQEQEQ